VRFVPIIAYFVLAVVISAPQRSPVSCETVRALSQILGRERLEAIAKSRGYTAEQIREAAKCLKITSNARIELVTAPTIPGVTKT
jgi:hypothetical protein